MDERVFCVGIDMSKDSFHACCKAAAGMQGAVIRGTRQFACTAAGFEALLAWAKAKAGGGRLLYVMEATGIYHEDLAYFLHSKGCMVAVVLANKIKHFAKSLNIKTKTDKSDASMIAGYGLERHPDAWQPMKPCMKGLRDLCRERLGLKKHNASLKNQYHALRHSHAALPLVMEMKCKQIEFFEGNIKDIEKEIRRIVAADQDFQRRVDNISRIKGVGDMTIITVVAEANGFELFSSIRQVVSFAGLDVVERQSGQSAGRARISKKGNPRIRQCLYLPGLSAGLYNELFKPLYQRVAERNPGTKRKSIVACMRKLLVLIYTLWKKDEAYDPAYQWGTAV